MKFLVILFVVVAVAYGHPGGLTGVPLGPVASVLAPATIVRPTISIAPAPILIKAPPAYGLSKPVLGWSKPVVVAQPTAYGWAGPGPLLNTGKVGYWG